MGIAGMRKTSHGVTIKLQKFSGGDVSLEILICLALGACVAAIVGWVM